MTGPITVAAMNRKGGCGKTSTIFHLAGTLALQGRRVLLVDMDPQASLTQGIFGPAATEMIAREYTVAALFDDALDPDPDDLIMATPFEGISLVAGSNFLDDYNLPRPHETGDFQFALRRFLKDAGEGFDVVLVDNPPNLNLCTWSSLVAADYVVVTVQPEDFGSQGIIYVQKAFDLALAKCNPRLRLAGYLLTLCDKRLGIHGAYEREIRTLYGPKVFTASVPLAKDFKEAVGAGRPIGLFRPKSPSARAIQAVAEELLARVSSTPRPAPEYLYLGHRVGSESIDDVAVA